MSDYLWRVICAAMICALVGAVGGSGTGYSVRRLMSGLFLVMAVLSPLKAADLPHIDTTHIRADAQAAVREGMQQAQQAQNAIISESLEAYIWNKAAGLGMELQVHVFLDHQGVPESVELTGTASPADRKALSESIERELGLGKEAQIWTIPHQSSE